MKKTFIVFLAIVLISLPTVVNARFIDVPEDTSYNDSVDSVTALGIMDGGNNLKFNPDVLVTREEFSTIMVRASGLSEYADALKGSSIYPDVDPDSPASGYINEALNKGFINGMADGKFHPGDPITYAQVCTVMVRALGYTDEDVSGIWPKNYIDKAEILGLAAGITLQNNDGIPRWAMALMVDRLLNIEMKKNSISETGKTFSESVGIYTDCIITGNSDTYPNLTENQVLTDKGIFYVDGNIKLELGNKYSLVIKNDTISRASKPLKKIECISVEHAIDTRVTYKEKDLTGSIVLPEKTNYYYNGARLSYGDIKSTLQAKSSLVFAYNNDNSGYEYAVIFDPVYSKPEISSKYDPASGKIGALSLPDGIPVIRNGDLVKAEEVEENDVVYIVSDIWGNPGYILSVASQETGKITAVLPNKISATAIQIDGTNYNISPDMDFNKVSNRNIIKTGDTITALLDHDGRIVDIIYPDGGNTTNFAFVVNYSTSTSINIADYGKISYTVKLLLTNGAEVTYESLNDPSDYKGSLVYFTKNDDEIVTLNSITSQSYGEVLIKKDERQIGDNCVSDNISIFNYVSNPSGSDCIVSLVEWSDLPYGVLPSGKVAYMNKTGSFDDVNILVMNDIFSQYYKTAYVKKVDSVKSGRSFAYSHTLLIDGKEYMHTTNSIHSAGSAVKVSFSNETVNYIYSVASPVVSTSRITAIDFKRVKINGTVYWFKNNITIYYKDISGSITMIGIDDIDLSRTYRNVQVYLDKPLSSNGRAEVLIISE